MSCVAIGCYSERESVVGERVMGALQSDLHACMAAYFYLFLCAFFWRGAWFEVQRQQFH